MCVDSGSLEEIEEVVIRDRQHLSEDGIVVPIIAIDKHTGRMESRPEMVTRGFLPPTTEPSCWRRARRDLADDRAIEPGREDGLERDQGKDSRGFEALSEQADLETAADFAGDSGSLTRNPGFFFLPLIRIKCRVLPMGKLVLVRLFSIFEE